MNYQETCTAYTTNNMANLIIENTGVDHVYPDGVPIVVLEIVMTDIYKRVARVSSLRSEERRVGKECR